MSADARPTFLARLARRPMPIFLGAAVGFLACCAAGRAAARQQPYENFVRFHAHIAPESHYYPTYAQALNLARQHVKPGKVLVVVGGNSVLYGTGQRESHVWTRQLQELLGDDYVVLNLAMRGGWPNEFGGLIAEQLATEGVAVVVVVAGAEHVGWGTGWDGQIYRYAFWDAWGKGLLPPESRRDQWLEQGFYEEYENQQPKDAKARRELAERRDAALEMRRRGFVDGVTYSQDLWNYVAYHYRGTVWTSLKYPKFWAPHRNFQDQEPGSLTPWEFWNNPSQEAPELRILRGVIQHGIALGLHQGKGHTELGNRYKAYMPEILQSRTLFVLRMEGVYFRKLMPPDERATYEDMFCRYGDAVRQSGLSIAVLGQNYGERDYADRSHFSEAGGRKVAEDLAPLVRAMSERLYGARPAPAGGKP